MMLLLSLSPRPPFRCSREETHGPEGATHVSLLKGNGACGLLGCGIVGYCRGASTRGAGNSRTAAMGGRGWGLLLLLAFER